MLRSSGLEQSRGRSNLGTIGTSGGSGDPSIRIYIYNRMITSHGVAISHPCITGVCRTSGRS